MNSGHRDILTELERDAFKEIINIAFGKAAASLADIIGLYVILSVPKVEILQPGEIQQFIEREVNETKGLNIIEQYYIGKIRGAAFLVLSYENSKQLLSLLGGEEQKESLNFFSIAMLEQETVTEIGNIIIGACVSKTAELLKDFVTYTPPRFIGGKFSGYDLPQKLFDKETYAIVLKTLFQFENKDINGHLFLVNSVESLDWLKKAIHDYMKHYGYE